MSLLIFGYGYSARIFAGRAKALFSSVTGTVRDPTTSKLIEDEFVSLLRFNSTTTTSVAEVDPVLLKKISEVKAILISIPPYADGDCVYNTFATIIAQNKNLQWLGYLSTIGVYGNYNGEWVDETSELRHTNERSILRAKAEQSWLQFGKIYDVPVHIFRLAGIYGPGQNALINVALGKANRVFKPGQVFNRIHVDDIATVLIASLAHPKPQSIYNVCDDEPAPPQDVVLYAATLLNVEPPPLINLEEAQISAMARSFYNENKRASNRLICSELCVKLAYQNYRAGLDALYMQDRESKHDDTNK